MSQAYQNPVFDGIAGVSIAGLLGATGLALIEVYTSMDVSDRTVHAYLGNY